MAILLAYMTFCTKADTELRATAEFEAETTKITIRKGPKPYGVGVISPSSSRIPFLFDAYLGITKEFLYWTFCMLVF